MGNQMKHILASIKFFWLLKVDVVVTALVEVVRDNVYNKHEETQKRNKTLE